MGASDGSDQPAISTSSNDDDSGLGQRSLIVIGTVLFVVGLAVVLGVQVGGMFAPSETTDTPSPTATAGADGDTAAGDRSDATASDDGGTSDETGETNTVTMTTTTDASSTGTPWRTPTDGLPTVSPVPNGTSTPTPTPTPESTPTETGGGIIDW